MLREVGMFDIDPDNFTLEDAQRLQYLLQPDLVHIRDSRMVKLFGPLASGVANETCRLWHVSISAD